MPSSSNQKIPKSPPISKSSLQTAQHEWPPPRWASVRTITAVQGSGVVSGRSSRNLPYPKTMAKPNGTAAGSLIKSTSEDPRWGTWEELLLACVVNRYGTDDWDSVAAEVQKHSYSSNPLLLTPPNCLKKYLQLTGHRHISDDSVPLLEELRELRVAELRRELERYDLSIVSQLIS